MSAGRRLLAAVFLVAIVGIIIVFATGIVAVPLGQPSVVVPLTVTRSSCERPTGFFLIIADLSGFNDSIHHGAPVNPWPVITVKQGETVRILVCNQDSTQAHGFAIGTYFEKGVVMAPGEAYRITFTATVPGSFVMYCNIFCTVHVFMRGQLIVQPKT
jgi:uncharacterized cupredoxin-like copper-binding protein